MLEKQKVRRILCPHCEQEIRLHLSVEVSGVGKWEGYDDGRAWTDGMSDEQIALVNAAQESGLFKAFSEAVLSRTAVAGQPKSLERFLITFFKTMRQNRVPLFVLQHYVREFGRNESIEVWSAQGLCAVIAGRSVRCFVPIDVFKGAAISSLTGKNTSRIGGDEESFQSWVKTRHGYVPAGSNVFLSEMRRKSIGEFARPSMSGA
jgi:hypothetical protein